MKSRPVTEPSSQRDEAPADIEPPDAEILARAAQNDAQSFRLFVDRHKRGIFAYLVCRTQRADVAEDLTQETFLRAFRAARTGAFAGRSSARTWLFTIAANCARDHWRAMRREHGDPRSSDSDDALAAMESPLPAPDVRAEQAETSRNTLEAVACLPEEQRQVIALKFMAGMTFGEIAEITGVPVPTAKSRARYALAKLYEMLAPKWEDMR